MADLVECPTCGRRNRVPLSAKGLVRCGNCHRPLPWVVEADDESFDDAVDSSVPVFVDLWAPWCGPCRQMESGLDEMARTFAGKLKVVRVNVDKAPAISARFEARSIPTLALLRDGGVVERRIGAMPTPNLLQWVREHVG